MRRLWFILLCGLLVVPAALAAARATGDGVLELRAVNGTVIVSGARGTLWGQMASGTLRVVSDPIVGDGTVLVSNADKTRSPSDTVTIYSGKDLHFRVTGGKYRLSFKGSGIYFVAVGVGVAQLTGDPFADDTGDYARDNGKWLPVPWTQINVQFGVPPATAGGPAPSP